MENQHKKIVLFLYNRLYDPVIQSNIFLYIKDLAAAPGSSYKFAIITYEDPELPLTAAQKNEATAFFQQYNMEWYPLQWRRGTSLKKKAMDILAGLKVVLQLRFKGYRHLVTLASIAGAYGYLYARLTGYRLYLYQYEPHSEYAVDNKIWHPASRQFKVLNYLEKKSALHAHVISTGTRHMMKRLQEWDVRAQVFQVRSVVNEGMFVFNEAKREEYRQRIPQLKPQDPLILYAGKFGDLYYYDEIPRTISLLLSEIPGSRALIVTLNDVNEIRQLFRKYGLTEDKVLITTSSYPDMPHWLSAADFALVAVPPAPSKKFISNIKVGEYLCCGLPYMIAKGISEDDSFAEENNVGVVVDNFEEAAVRKAIPRIRAYLSEDKKALRDRCRKKGIEYRGFSLMKVQFEKALSALVSN